MDLLERFERWTRVGMNLLCVFFAGVIFTILLMLACFIYTGGK